MVKSEKHHVLFPSRVWNVFDSGRRLRSTPELIVPLFLGAHHQIHTKLEQVPLPDTYTLDKLEAFEPVRNNTVFTIYALQHAIHEAVNFDARSSRIARELGMLVCEALEIQVGIIKGGQL